MVRTLRSAKKKSSQQMNDAEASSNANRHSGVENKKTDKHHRNGKPKKIGPISKSQPKLKKQTPKRFTRVISTLSLKASNRKINSEAFEKEVAKAVTLFQAQNASQNSSENAGTTIGNYVLGDCVGKGAFGDITQAIHKKTGHIVAIKTITKGDEDCEEGEALNASIKAESILAKCNHANIVRLLEVIDNDNDCSFVMELAHCNLREYCHKLKDYQAIIIFYCILRGLHFLHMEQIVHRDIKGSNILLTSNGKPMIADFGLAQYLNDENVKLEKRGTTSHMSPEMYNNEDYNLKTDIYSLGCVVLEIMLAWQPLCGDRNLEAYNEIDKVLETDITFNKKTAYYLSYNLRIFTKKCLIKDKSKRPCVSKCLNDPWFRSFNLKKFMAEKPSPSDNTINSMISKNHPDLIKTKANMVKDFTSIHGIYNLYKHISTRCEPINKQEIKFPFAPIREPKNDKVPTAPIGSNNETENNIKKSDDNNA